METMHDTQYTIYIFDRPRGSVVGNIISAPSVCLYVCLSDDNFRKPWCSEFIFILPVPLGGIRVRIACEVNRGHGSKKGFKNSYFAM